MAEQFDEEKPEIEESDVPYTHRVYEFLASLDDPDETERVFYLYKYDHPITGKQKTFCNKFTCIDPPEQNAIGEEYGGGRYFIIMVLPPRPGEKTGTTKTYRFKLHSRFDDVAKKLKIEQNLNSIQMQPQQPPVNNMVETFGVLERFIAILTPLLIPLLQRPPKDESVQSILSDTYNSVNELLKNSLMENFRMVRTLKNEIKEGESTEMRIVETEPAIEKPDYLSMIFPLLSEWLPKLIGGGVQGAAVSQAIRSTPQFRDAISDRNELNKLVNFLVQSQGIENTNKLLSILKINKRVPDNLQNNNKNVNIPPVERPADPPATRSPAPAAATRSPAPAQQVSRPIQSAVKSKLSRTTNSVQSRKRI